MITLFAIMVLLLCLGAVVASIDSLRMIIQDHRIMKSYNPLHRGYLFGRHTVMHIALWVVLFLSNLVLTFFVGSFLWVHLKG